MSTEDPDGATGASVAYFSMEIALQASIPTYAGGLGVLAGDTIRAAADVELPMVAVSLRYRQGYFRQRLDGQGHQAEEPSRWSPESLFQEQAPRAVIQIENKPVHLRAWRFDVTGVGGFAVPVYLLDTDFDENGTDHRGLTDHLYGGDQRYRLCQEAVLGLGGVAILRALGYKTIRSFHMNEGHQTKQCPPEVGVFERRERRCVGRSKDRARPCVG